MLVVVVVMTVLYAAVDLEFTHVEVVVGCCDDGCCFVMRIVSCYLGLSLCRCCCVVCFCCYSVVVIIVIAVVVVSCVLTKTWRALVCINWIF